MAKERKFYIYQPHFFGGNSIIATEGLSKYRYYNGEDIDIFSDPNYIQPSVIFQDNSISGVSNVTGFTIRSNGYLYCLGQNSTPKAVIYYKTTPSGSSPSSWTSVITSANAPATQGYSPITAFKTTESGTTKEYLYYHTSSSTLSRYGDLGGTPTETASFGTLTGLTSSDRLCHLVYNGELFIANGNYIARVTSTGNFVDKSYTLPTGLRVVDIIPMVLTTGGDYLAILCSDTNNPNQSQVVIWDMVATSGFIAKIRVPVAKPQWIQKLGSIFLIAGVNPNNKLEIYTLTGLISSDYPVFIINNVSYSLTRPVSPVNTKFTLGNLFHFGVEGIEKSGIYAIQELIPNQPSITLLHRFSTTDYTKHRPLAFYAVADAKYVSYYDAAGSGTYYVALANAQNPTYSSNAILETLLFDAGSPYMDKLWNTFQIGLEPLPANCSITITGRKNLTDTYTNLNNTSSSVSTTNQTIQEIPIEGFMGRSLQLKLSFTSSNSNRAKVKWIGIEGEYNYLT